MMKSVSLVFSVLGLGANAAGWNYEEPGNNVSHWGNYAAECNFRRQSPIDLPNFDSLPDCSSPLTLQWSTQSTHWAVQNSGHSLKATPMSIDHSGGDDLSGLSILSHANDTDFRLPNRFYKTFESPINKEYCLDSLHFHWGRDSSEGSEHTVDGKSFPLELHLVHYSCSYDNAGAALNDYATGKAGINYDDENVLAVIGVFFEIGDPNPALERLLQEAIIDGVAENTASEFENLLEFFYTEFNPRDFLPQSKEYVAYLGSLTTPPCYETVRWHVLKEPATVSEEQMLMFRMILEGTDANKTQAPNYRPPQPRNGRTVYSCESQVEEIETYFDKDETQTDSSSDSDDDSDDDKWMAVAVAFIVLFALMFIGCTVVACYLRSTLRRIESANQAKGAKSHSELSPTSPSA